MKKSAKKRNRGGKGRSSAALSVLRACLMVLLACLMILLLTGCGGDSDSVTVLRVWDAESTLNTESGEEPTFRVGIVTDVGGIDDASFNASAWKGLQELARSANVTVGYTVPTTAGSLSESFEQLVEEDYDLIWGIGFTCADALLEAAIRWPDTRLALVDAAYENPPDNVTCVVFRAEDASFLVGYIAARNTRTGKVGFVGGVVSEAIDKFQYGFQAGAAWADRETGQQTEILIEYANSFADEKRGKEIALSMIEAGCDIVYHAAGATGIGVLQAAEEKQVYAIGVDQDQSYLAPTCVLTSALKKVDVAVYQVSRDCLAGRDIGGQVYQFGLPEGAVGIPENHSLYSDAIYDSALRISDAIVNGAISPPCDAESFQQFLDKISG